MFIFNLKIIELRNNLCSLSDQRHNLKHIKKLNSRLLLVGRIACKLNISMK